MPCQTILHAARLTHALHCNSKALSAESLIDHPVKPFKNNPECSGADISRQRRILLNKASGTRLEQMIMPLDLSHRNLRINLLYCGEIAGKHLRVLTAIQSQKRNFDQPYVIGGIIPEHRSVPRRHNSINLRRDLLLNLRQL